MYVKDEQLDTIISLIFLMLTMLRTMAIKKKKMMMMAMMMMMMMMMTYLE